MNYFLLPFCNKYTRIAVHKNVILENFGLFFILISFLKQFFLLSLDLMLELLNLQQDHTGLKD